MVFQSKGEGRFAKFVSFVEEDRTNIVTAFIIIFLISFARTKIESWVFQAPSESLYSYANDIAFFFAVFVLGALIISVFSKTNIRKIANLIILFWWIILLPPLVDNFITGRSGFGQGYYYFTLSDLISRFVGVFSEPGGAIEHMGIGEGVQFLLIIVLAGIYTAYKTRSVLRSIGIVVVFPFLFTLITSMAALITMHPEDGFILFSIFKFPLFLQYYPGMDLATANFVATQQWLLFITSYYLIVFLLGSALLVAVKNRALFLSFLKTIRPARMLHGALMALIGILVSGTLGLGHPLHWPYIFLAMGSITFAWQFTTMSNDIHDVEIDEISHHDRPLILGTMTIGQYRQISYLFAILSMATSFLLGPIPFLLVLACLALGYAYSAPPFRLRDRLASTAVIGTGSLLAYLVGVFTPSFWIARYYDVLYDVYGNPLLDANGNFIPNPSTYHTHFFGVGHAITWEILVIGLIILIALSLAPIISAYEDMEGDKKSGVKTIHTIYGKGAGKKFIYIIIPILFLLPALLFHTWIDIIMFIIFFVFGLLSFKEFESSKTVFVMYFFELVYCILRYTSLIII